MKAIILAAGQGTRLRPLTDEKPKCMVKFQNKAIITYILEAMKICGLDDIAVVNGYKKEVLEAFLPSEVTCFTNENYTKTNMVSTLFCAESFMDDDLIVSYGDIIYKPEILEKLMASTADISVVVDRQWKELWSQRMDNPLSDAETLKLNRAGNIIELGKKPTSYDDIEGQYIGLIKISKKALKSVKSFYDILERDALYEEQNFDNMYMTSFIQMIIDNLCPVEATLIDGGWLEIDSVDDLKAYEESGSINVF